MTIVRRAPLVLGALLAALLGAAGVALPALRAEMLSALAAAPPDLPPGWGVTISAGGATLRDHAEQPAFALRPGESLHPAAPSAGFSAAFVGDISIPEPGAYRFIAEHEGGATRVEVVPRARTPVQAASATSAGWLATPWVSLPAGSVLVRIEMRRDADLPCRLRGLWEMRREGLSGFRPEPIPASIVRVPASLRADADRALLARRGRVLMGDLGCLSCHAPAPESSSAVHAFTAPALTGVAGRARPEWIERWIAHPQHVRPGSRMPGVLGEARSPAADARAITHFLVSLAAPVQNPEPAFAPEVIERGRNVYRETGCVACHGPGAEAMGDVEAIAPLADMADKWRAGALAEFLRDPHAAVPGSRMPSMSLSAEEADAAAVFLASSRAGSRDDAPPFAVDPALAARGREAFAARGCASCHEVVAGGARIAPTSRAPALSKLRASRGCLSPRDPRSPRYALSDSDRAALSAAVTEAGSWRANPAPLDRARRTVASLGCASCHEWHGTGGVPGEIAHHFITRSEVDLGDEGRLPPRLTGAGERLATQWLDEVLAGSGRARPYMGARMPRFPAASIDTLASDLAALDGVWPGTDSRPPEPTGDMIRAGRFLVGADAMNCISCHVVGDLPPAGTPGPDLLRIAGRHRYEWWDRFMFDPPRVHPGTRMPAFFKPAPATSVLSGDAQRQADAIWAYLSLGEFAPPPEGLAVGGLAVLVGERPIVLRTFLKAAGSRGIAIGFPQGVHAGFDAENVRLVEVWRGPFLDATGAWLGRGGTIVSGQGKIEWTAPPGPAVFVGERPDAGAPAPKFLGYVLDADGYPTLRYAVRDPAGREVRVAERLEPGGAAGPMFRRHFSLHAAHGGILAWVNVGDGYSRVRPAGDADVGQPAEAGGLRLVPVRGGGTIEFVVEIEP